MRIALICTILALLSACGGEKGKMLLKGELSGLRQGELLIWNNDGFGNQSVDTIFVQSGRFEYSAPASDETSVWTLVYPNMSTLSIFGRSGDVLRLEGKANELRQVEVKGSRDNELYTDFRLGRITADSLIAGNATLAVAKHVYKTQFLNNSKADKKAASRLYKILKAAMPGDEEVGQWEAIACPALCKGKKMPAFSLIDSEGDTLTLKTFKGKHLLIGVWASWKVESREMLRQFRAERRKHGKKIELLTVNVDAEPRSRTTFEKIDSITWRRINTSQMFHDPQLKAWLIDDVPYIILVDTAGVVRAIGSDFSKDIQPALDKL